MDKRLTILKNVVSLQIAQILIKIINITFVAFAARYFGAEGFGQWALVFLFVAFFGLLSDFGLDTLAIRDVARNYEMTEKYLRNILGFKLISSVFIAVLMLFFVRAVGYTGKSLELFTIAVPLLIFSTLSGPFVSILKAHERMEVTSAIEVLFGFLPSASGLFLIWLGYGIEFILGVFSFWAGVKLMVLISIVRREISVFRPELDFGFLKKISKDALFFALLGIIMMIHIRVDFFMLSRMVGDEAVGVYAAPYKILEHIAMMGVLINVAFQPTISALYVRAKDRLVRVYEQLQKFFLTMALPIFSVLIIYHREITIFFFGPQYENSVQVLFILSWACGLLFFTTPMRVIILQSNLLSRFAPVVAGSMFLNIILNFIFIPKYTYIGAAWVSLNSTVIDLFIRIHFVRKVLDHKVNYFSMLLRPVVALAAMLITLFLLETIFLPVRVLIALVPYILLLRWLNVYSKEEIDRFIKEPFSKIVSHVRGQR